jgi:hypothetical protein
VPVRDSAREIPRFGGESGALLPVAMVKRIARLADLPSKERWIW